MSERRFVLVDFTHMNRAACLPALRGGARLRPAARSLSLLRSPFSLGIGSSVKIATDDCWSAKTWAAVGRHAWRSALHSTEAVTEQNDLSRGIDVSVLPQRSSRSATFVAMMQTAHLGERNNLACVCGEAADNPC